MFISLLGAGPAHARPSFELGASGVRAGDVVPFTISDVDGWGVAYHLELAGDDLQDGRSRSFVAGSFRMPDLGEEGTTVTLDARLWWSDTSRWVTRNLEYLGPALPADPPSPAPTSTAPAAAPQAAPSPGPSAAPKPAKGRSPSRRATRKRHGGRQKPRRQSTETQRSDASGGSRSRRAQRDRKRGRRGDPRSRRSARPTGPFLNGYTGPGEAQAGDPGDATPKPGAPRKIALAAQKGGISAAIAVPVVLTLGALTLVVTALMRKRRLSARSAR